MATSKVVQSRTSIHDKLRRATRSIVDGLSREYRRLVFLENIGRRFKAEISDSRRALNKVRTHESLEI